MRTTWLVAGLIVASVGCSHMPWSKHHEEENEGNEVKMSINDVPPAVKASLMKEANGAKINTVDKEMADGKTVYETDVMMNGQNWELKVDESGNLISKKVDNEEAEKAAKSGKKHEKEEEKEEKEK